MSRLHGRKGFTMKKAIRGLIEPHEVAGKAGKHQVPIERLPAELAAELLRLLPESQRGDRPTAVAPSFADLVELGLGIPGSRLTGYRIGPEHDHERITLTGIVIPNEVLNHEAVRSLARGVEDLSVIGVGADGSVFASWASR